MNCIKCNEPMEKHKSDRDSFYQCMKCKSRYLKRAKHFYEITDNEKLREVPKNEMPEMW